MFGDLFDRTLVVASHPDDEILGCGGTMRKITDHGCAVRTLILGEGKTSRDETRDRTGRKTEISQLRQEIQQANHRVGVSDVHVLDFPDNRFDSVELLDIVKVIEKHVEDFAPTTVLTHFEADMNVDHTITNRAVLTATRPQPDQTVQLVAAFEVLSSTGWYYPHTFVPSLFVELSETQLDAKVAAMEAYGSELREYPHPRSLEAIRSLALSRGTQNGSRQSEVFAALRLHL